MSPYDVTRPQLMDVEIPYLVVIPKIGLGLGFNLGRMIYEYIMNIYSLPAVEIMILPNMA